MEQTIITDMRILPTDVFDNSWMRTVEITTEKIEANRKKYLEELRSGKWTKGCIKSDEYGFPIIESEEDDKGTCACGIIYHLFPKEDGTMTMLHARKSLGITRVECDYIQRSLNDNHLPFSEVADIIERTIFCKDFKKRTDEGDWFRADGDCLCPTCNQPYKLHPNAHGYPWLNTICNGWLVKL
jgi:hypothetical protein